MQILLGSGAHPAIGPMTILRFPAALRRTLRAAADLLIAGTPLHSGGKLTITSLAAEAGIKRWVLTHQHPELMRSYQAESASLGKTPAPLQDALDRLRQAQDDLTSIRAEKKRLAELNRTYATVIHDLTDNLLSTRRQRDQTLADINSLRGVEVLADHRSPAGTPRSAS
jgi:hypothetical protein